MKTLIKDWLEYLNYLASEMVLQILFVLLAVAVGMSITLTGLNLPVNSAYQVIEGRQTVILVAILGVAFGFSIISLTVDFAVDRLFPPKDDKQATPTAAAETKNAGA